MKSIGVMLTIIGILVLSFATIGSIGYGLYLWGGVGLTLAVAAWTAFTMWLKAVGVGIVLLVVGFFMGDTV